MTLISQKMRELAPELDPLRIGTGWKPEDLDKPQIFIESTFGDADSIVLQNNSRRRRKAPLEFINNFSYINDSLRQ